MRWTRRRFLMTGTFAGAALAADAWPRAVRGQGLRTITVAHRVFVIEEKDYDNGMKVFIPVAVETPIPYRHAVDMGFVKKAHAKIAS
jgi:hypothetical protein